MYKVGHLKCANKVLKQNSTVYDLVLILLPLLLYVIIRSQSNRNVNSQTIKRKSDVRTTSRFNFDLLYLLDNYAATPSIYLLPLRLFPNQN